MSLITVAQIQKARSISLLQYMKQTVPDEITLKGKRHYHAKHDSFVIDNGKDGGWYWNSKGEGGHSALDFLIKIERMDFKDAVVRLGGDNIYTKSTQIRHHKETSKQDHDEKKIIMPIAAPNNNNAIKYLENRGLSEHTIKRAIASGLLYESNNKTCVFVGKDGNEPKYAYERGIDEEIKKDAPGSDKKFGFCIPAKDRNSKVMAVFESPLDALAHYEICKLNGSQWDGYRLSLGGVAGAALNSFIEKNPDIKVIQLCLDNDKTGNEVSTRITKEMIQNKTAKGRTITSSPPPKGKDYLEFLQTVKKEVKEQNKQLERPKDIQQRKQHTSR